MLEEVGKSCPTCCGDAGSGKDEYRYVLTTRSACFECVKQYPDEMRLVDAEVFIRDGKVYLKKFCPEHGPSYALKSSDADWYLKTFQPENIRSGAPIFEFQTDEEKAAPTTAVYVRVITSIPAQPWLTSPASVT